MPEILTKAFPPTDPPARRVLVQMAGLLTLTCFCMLATGAVIVSTMYGIRWEPGEDEWIGTAQFVTSAGVALWLIRLVAVRSPDRAVPPRRRPERAAAVAVGAAAMGTTVPGSSWPYPGVGAAVFGCAAAWLAVEVCRTNKVRVDNGLPVTAAGRLRTWQITLATAGFCALTGHAFSYLVLLFQRIGMAGLPVTQDSQMSTLGISSPASLGLAILHAVAVEDVVIVAATAAVMTAAGRPVWEIYTLTCVLEVALHAYYGSAAIGAVLFTAGRVWLYLRYRSILPLVAGHALWDAMDFFPWIPATYRPVVLWCVLLPGALILDYRLKTAADKERARMPSPVTATAVPDDATKTP